jgi:hypothetical protein
MPGEFPRRLPIADTIESASRVRASGDSICFKECEYSRGPGASRGSAIGRYQNRSNNCFIREFWIIARDGRICECGHYCSR